MGILNRGMGLFVSGTPGGTAPGNLQQTINGTTDNTGTYQYDALIDATIAQFFLDGTLKAAGDGWSFNSGTGTITVNPNIAGVAFSINYYYA